MIVLLEGVNCTGKTALAAKLSEHLKIEVLKINTPGEDPFEEFMAQLTTMRAQHRHFIVDRLHLSNYSCNGYLGDGVMSPEQWESVDRYIANEGGLLYWLLDTPSAIEARVFARNRGNEAAVLSRALIAHLQDRFQQAFDRSVIPNKGSFMLTQFIDDGAVTVKFFDHKRLLLACMAGMTC